MCEILQTKSTTFKLLCAYSVNPFESPLVNQKDACCWREYPQRVCYVQVSLQTNSAVYRKMQFFTVLFADVSSA